MSGRNCKVAGILPVASMSSPRQSISTNHNENKSLDLSGCKQVASDKEEYKEKMGKYIFLQSHQFARMYQPFSDTGASVQMTGGRRGYKIIQRGMLKQTVFINKIRMLQQTQTLQ